MENQIEKEMLSNRIKIAEEENILLKAQLQAQTERSDKGGLLC